MAGSNVALAFDILARDRASKTISDIGDSSDNLGRRLGKLAGAAVGAFAAFQAGRIVKDVFTDGVAAAREAIAIDNQTAAVIKSTGSAAGVTAEHVESLSNRLQKQQTISDELVQTGANLLLTFTNIRNEAGAGNDIFDQTVELAGDMSVALGQDMKSASILLGKALNDPAKGLSALTRVGVSFTDQQKEQIQALVETGDTMGAQKVILEELNTQFAGSAAAQSDAGKRASLAWADFQEVLGRLVLPAVDLLLDKGTQLLVWAADNLGPAMETVKAVVTDVSTAFGEEGFAGVVSTLLPVVTEAIDGIVGYVGDNLPIWLEQLAEWGAALVEWVVAAVPPLLQEAGKLLGALLEWAIDEGLPLLVSSLLEWGAAFVEWVAPLIPPLLIELGKLGLQLVGWMITDALPKLLGALAEWAGAFLGWVGGLILDVPGKLAEFGGVILSWLAEFPALISDAAAGMWDGIKDAFEGVINAIIRGWNSLQFKLPSFDGLKVAGKTVIPGFEGPTLGVPQIDPVRLATGGVITTPTLAVLGDGTGPNRREIVAPENTLRKIVREESGGRGLVGPLFGDVTIASEMDLELVARRLTQATEAVFG